MSDVAELAALAAERGVPIADLTAALRALPPTRAGPLARSERDALVRLGIDVDSRTRAPSVGGMLLRQELERAALTAAQAAELLDVDPSRVRQRLEKRSLLGFHRGSGRHDWLLPTFQFDLALHELPSWSRLLTALPAADETSPTALVVWLTSPQAHLHGRSRAQALADGYDLDHLLAEAATFGLPQ